MLTRLVQTKKAVIVLIILAANFMLFVKYSWNEVQKGKIGSVLELQNSRRSLNTGLEPQYAVQADNIADFSVPPVVIYNRVPKTGSTTFANIAYKLTERNRFNMLHVNTTFKNYHHLTILDQQRFVRNVSLWTEKQPALYHGHLMYLDFTRFGFPNPIYINIVRDPIERLVSYYYFLRFGDDYRPYLKRARAKDNKTLDECIAMRSSHCDLTKMMWIQIPFFCGQAVHCIVPSRWALDQAKHNLVNHFLLVGVTEQLGAYIALLETMLPQYFSGAYELYTKTELGHLRKTREKIQPSEATLSVIKKSVIYQLEQEFYEFARDQFNFLKSRTLTIDSEGRAIIKPPSFKYEKIFPQNPGR